MKPDGYTWDDKEQAAKEEYEATITQREAFENIEPDFRCDLIPGRGGRLLIYSEDCLQKAEDFLSRAFGTWNPEASISFDHGFSSVKTWHDHENNFDLWMVIT